MVWNFTHLSGYFRKELDWPCERILFLVTELSPISWKSLFMHLLLHFLRYRLQIFFKTFILKRRCDTSIFWTDIAYINMKIFGSKIGKNAKISNLKTGSRRDLEPSPMFMASLTDENKVKVKGHQWLWNLTFINIG